MAIKKTSPVEKFPGYVVLPKHLTLPQVNAFQDALANFGALGKDDEQPDRLWVSVLVERRLPAILACVDEWHIEDIPEAPTMETFPATPVTDADELTSWLFLEIRKIWIGETADPKN